MKTQERVIQEGNRASAPPAGRDREVLRSVALALNSTLELREVLRVLVGIALDAARADRCSIFLLEGDRLVPTAAIGRFRDEDLWVAFQEMDELRLDRIPGGRDALLSGAPVPIEDASASPLIPTEWQERFTLRSLVVVPLREKGIPCGAMVVDYQRPRPFSSELIDLLEAIGSYAGVAINNATLFEATRHKSELQAALAKAAANLVSPMPLTELAEELLEASLRISGAEVCAIGILDEHQRQIEAIATRGVRALEMPVLLQEVPDEIIKTLTEHWESEGPIAVGSGKFISRFLGIGTKKLSYFVLPIRAEDHVTGGILLGRAESARFSDQEDAALMALARIAAAAMERIWLLQRLDRQMHQMRILHDLAEVLARRMTADELVTSVNRLLRNESFRVISMSFRRGHMRRYLGGKPPSALDRQVLSSDEAVRTPTGLCVPMRLGGGLIGSIHVESGELRPSDEVFAHALADGIAQLCSRATLRAEIEESERESAIAAERGRIAADLHDTVGQAFIAIGLLARRGAKDGLATEEAQTLLVRIADLADSGKWDIDHAIKWLALFPEARGGILPSLEALKASFEDDSGLPIVFDRDGDPQRLEARTERALYRVACGALTNAWRYAGSTAIRMSLSFRQTAVTLSIFDDGTGVSTRHLDGRVRRGLAMMRMSVSEVGGSLRITSIRPRGVIVTAEVPVSP